MNSSFFSSIDLYHTPVNGTTFFLLHDVTQNKINFHQETVLTQIHLLCDFLLRRHSRPSALVILADISVAVPQ